MKQKYSAASVYHDMERDIYFRIDKATGREERSHKNGMPLQTFKVNVSGSDPHRRTPHPPLPDKIEPTQLHLSNRKPPFTSKLKPIAIATSKFTTIVNGDSGQKHLLNSVVRAQSHVRSERMRSQEGEGSFLTNLEGK